MSGPAWATLPAPGQAPPPATVEARTRRPRIWPEAVALLVGLAAGVAAVVPFWEVFGTALAAVAAGAIGTLVSRWVRQAGVVRWSALLVGGGAAAAMATLARGEASALHISALAVAAPFLALALRAEPHVTLLMLVPLVLGLLGTGTDPVWTQGTVDVALFCGYLLAAALAAREKPWRYAFLWLALAVGAPLAASSVSSGQGIGPWDYFLPGAATVVLAIGALLWERRRNASGAATLKAP